MGFPMSCSKSLGCGCSETGDVGGPAMSGGGIPEVSNRWTGGVASAVQYETGFDATALAECVRSGGLGHFAACRWRDERKKYVYTY